MKTATPSRKALYGISSVLVGLWAFKKVNEISGPSFEPILAACTNPELSTMRDFVQKSGYHEYEPKVGFGIFNVLVCLITQFLLELRNTYPEGLLVWSGVLLAALPFGVMSIYESGRGGVKKFSPIRYPIIIGLLAQLFGISVVFPLIWVPGYIWGFGNGPVSYYRFKWIVPLLIPGWLLTFIVFTAGTSSYTWTVAAGILGGPGVTLAGAVLWLDKVPPLTIENAQRTKKRIEFISKAVAMFGAIVHWVLLWIAIRTYDSFGDFYIRVWAESNASVKFMVIDTLVLYASVLLWIAFHDEMMAIKAFRMTPLIGFGAAPLLLLPTIEEIKTESIEFETPKKYE